MLDAGFWILDGIRNDFFDLSSIEHPATSISMLQAVKLINAHKLVGLPANERARKAKLRYIQGVFTNVK